MNQPIRACHVIIFFSPSQIRNPSYHGAARCRQQSQWKQRGFHYCTNKNPNAANSYSDVREEGDATCQSTIA